MRGKLICIATAAAAALAGTASAGIAPAGGEYRNVGRYNHGTLLVQARHYPGAGVARAGGIPDSLAAAAGDDACRMSEPSKLGLLRSTRPVARSATAAQCRKLKS